MPKECQLKLESLDKSRFYLSLDPPKSPNPPPPPPRGERRGTKELLSPPFLRGVGGDLRGEKTRPRGDLDLIVKQQSLAGFDLKLTLLGLLEYPYGEAHDRRVYFINVESAVNVNAKQ
jgi:hypothetical protein